MRFIRLAAVSLALHLVSTSFAYAQSDTISDLHRAFYNAILQSNTLRMQRLLSSPLLDVDDDIEGVPGETYRNFVDVAISRCLDAPLVLLLGQNARITRSDRSVKQALELHCFSTAQKVVNKGYDLNRLTPDGGLGQPSYYGQIFRDGKLDIFDFFVANKISANIFIPKTANHFDHKWLPFWLALLTVDEPRATRLKTILTSAGKDGHFLAYKNLVSGTGYNMMDVFHNRCSGASEDVQARIEQFLTAMGMGAGVDIADPVTGERRKGLNSFACWSIIRLDDWGSPRYPAKHGPRN